jgi:hypothetical protein
MERTRLALLRVRCRRISGLSAIIGGGDDEVTPAGRPGLLALPTYTGRLPVSAKLMAYFSAR